MSPYMIPGYTKIRQAWLDNTQSAVIGQKKSKQAQDDLEQQPQKIIDQNKSYA